MQTGAGLAVSCEVSADRLAARMQRPPMQLAGLKKPIAIYVNLDARGTTTR